MRAGGPRRARRRVPRARRAADLRRDRDRLRPHRHAVRLRARGHPPRPALSRQGDDRGLPADVGDRRVGRGVRRVPRPRPVGEDAVPRALVQRERARRRGRAPSPRAASRRGTCSPTCGRGPRSCATCSTTASRRCPQVARRPAARADGRRRARAARATVCAGAGGPAPARSSAGCCSARSATP